MLSCASPPRKSPMADALNAGVPLRNADIPLSYASPASFAKYPLSIRYLRPFFGLRLNFPAALLISDL